MRLPDYDYSQNGYYFITICTYNKQKLFEKSIVGNDLCVVPSNFAQNKIIEKWLFELQNKFGIIIDRYVIMPDHIHFILIINSEQPICRSIPDMMQWFKTMTTNEYIHLVKSDILKPFNKKLWQKSFYDHIIRDENDYKAKSQYIINNPIDEREKYK